MVCLDWLDPLRNTGQWLPEISEMAGGEEGLAIPRGHSRELSWDEVREYAPGIPYDYALRLRAGTLPAGSAGTSSPYCPGGKTCLPSATGGPSCSTGASPAATGREWWDVLEGLAEVLHPEQFAGLAPPGVFDPEPFV